MEDNQNAVQAENTDREALSALLREEVRTQVDAALQAAAARLDARERDIERREGDVIARALTISCEEALKKRGLPPELAQALSVPNEEAVETVVSALEKAFRAAVQQGVEQRLSGSTPDDSLPFQDVRELSDEEYFDYITSRHS